MSVQASTNITNVPFIRGAISYVKQLTILQDAARSAVLAFGTVMAYLNAVVPTTGTAGGSNVGDGTVTGVAASGAPGLLIGTYTLICTFAVTNGGVFKLTDPNGNIVADNLTLRVGDGLLTSFNAGGLVFTVTEGTTTDFSADDEFTIAVAGGGGYVPLDPAGVDGSQLFAGIYVGQDIAAADLVAGDIDDSLILIGGACPVDLNQIVYENSATLTTLQSDGKTIEQAMQSYGIFPMDTVDISSFENA